jgi:hypothetical protein
MSYIIKNTAGLINTRLTDVGRRKLSQGNFNITYFQIGDSEVSYTAVPNYNSTNNSILMPAFNAQNDTGAPESNKQNVKYPYYVQGDTGNTYGIPYMDSNVEPVYNSAGVKGFFTGSISSWEMQISSAYTVNSQYIVPLNSLNGTDQILAESSPCIFSNIYVGSGTPQNGDFLVLYLDGIGSCNTFSGSPILTYQIESIEDWGTLYPIFTVDRPTPIYVGSTGDARILIYPASMVEKIPYPGLSAQNYPYIYDYPTPMANWETDTLNFETPCDVARFDDTKIWNMNIPWSESPAGLNSSFYENYTEYGSVGYIGSKEYWNYQNESGGTDTGEVYFYNSFDEKVLVRPKDQKAIAIVHYTNQSIDNVYGEKFALLPTDPLNPDDKTGLARHFKISLPTLLWHKNPGTSFGETFYVEPPNYESLFVEYYLKSTKNLDMNDPGIRYYYLYDTHPDINNNLNRVGRVFPDQQTVVFDDEEIIAALSYKSNRNWTLPAPKLGLITPNICGDESGTSTGVLTSSTEYMYVTYRFNNTNRFANGADTLHCNYYVRIQGPTGSTTDSNVTVRFGVEFPYLISGGLNGFSATDMQLLCQKVTGDTRPSPTNWKVIDVTSQLQSAMINGYITQSSITGTTFVINTDNLSTSTPYILGNEISIPDNNSNLLNFGDEYFFYGNLETDIQATIYQMKYLINLSRNQFTDTSNPTWTSGTTSYVSEIGLYDVNKDLIVISKLQSPEIRQGIQQYVVKLDF